MRKRKGFLAVLVLLIAMLLAVWLLPVMTGLITKHHINLQPTVTATPIPQPEMYWEEVM